MPSDPLAPKPTPKELIPKVRRVRPGWTLKPASRAAFVRGCQCYTTPGLAAEGRGEHQAHCPLRKPEEPCQP